MTRKIFMTLVYVFAFPAIVCALHGYWKAAFFLLIATLFAATLADVTRKL